MRMQDRSVPGYGIEFSSTGRLDPGNGETRPIRQG